MEGSTYVFEPKREDLVVPPLADEEWLVKADYDYSTGSQPVRLGAAVVFAVIEWGRLDTKGRGGLVLRQVSQATYERIGWCHMSPSDLFPIVSRKAKLKDNFKWRYYRSFVASLPVRSFRIV